MTHLVNNIGLRDAIASKKMTTIRNARHPDFSPHHSLLILHLIWQSGFGVSSQKGEVSNVCLASKDRKSKPVVYNPQSRCEAELKEELSVAELS